MTQGPEAAAVAVKAAKKVLKKAVDGEMKLKDLTKTVDKKLQKQQRKNKTNADADVLVSSKEKIEEWLQESDHFSICEVKKVVRLIRKRSSSPHDACEELEKTSKKIKSGNSDDKSSDNNDSEKDAKKSKNKKSKSNGPLSLTQDWRTENKVVVMHTTDDEKGQEKTQVLQCSEAYFPFTSFDDPACEKSLNSALLKKCKSSGFSRPSPIQAQSWPILTSKETTRDLVGIAETGSGKTLAFSMPALSAMASSKRNGRRAPPRMLVLSPTRELAMQSDVVLQEFGAVVGIESLVVYGGVPKYQQTNELKKGNVDCVVATPGRLKDLIQEGNCDLSNIQYLVLDEADRLLDMGFEEDVRFIIEQCSRKDRQTVMFSATWPAAIQQMALEYMNEPVRVYVGFESIVGSNNDSDTSVDGTSKNTNGAVMVDDSLSANKRVQQNVYVIEDRQRESRLNDLLRKVHSGSKKNDRVLVFALYKKEVERLENTLRRQGWNCCSIHGNKNQADRTKALAEFKDGSCPLMIATDVAARGLDIPNVEAVINFTFPLTIEDYVHRIGRTGRAGKNGVSYTFFQPTDKSHAGELQQVMRQAGQEVPEELLKFGSTIKKKEHKLYGNFGPSKGMPMKQATKIKFNFD